MEMLSSSLPETAGLYVVEDCGDELQVLSDGTIVRSSPPPAPVTDDGRVEWKDAIYDAGHSIGLRMYRPRCRDVTDTGEEEEEKKLPVLVYFHGGGFCVGSCSWPKTHAACLRLAAELPAVVLSFDYRLAPEHRLPAAHEDAATALLWLRDQLITSDNPWLAESADSRRVFISGVSAGGSLAHHMAVRFGTAGLEPGANVVGYILLMPGLFSAEPTQSELDKPDSAFLTQEMFDRFFRLGMPVGATRDHPLVNPFAPDSPSLEPARVGRMLVVAAELDFFRDRKVEYAERMKAMSKDVELVVFAGQDHGFFGMDPASDADGELVRVLRRFMWRNRNVNLD